MSEVELRRALTVQESVEGHLKLGSILMIEGVVSEHRLLRVLMDLNGVPAVSWRSLSEASEETVRLLPQAEALRWNAVPYALHQKVIGVAFAKPSPPAVAEIGWRTGLKVFPGVAPDVRILQAQERCYGLSIREPIRRLLASADGAAAAKLALEELLLLSKQTRATAQPEPTPRPNAPLPPPAVPRETGDEASLRTQALRDHVAEALAEFDSRARAIFASAEARETPPGAVVQVVRIPTPPADPSAAPPAARPLRKSAFTTEDLRELLTDSEPAAPKRPAGRRKTGFTTADLGELTR